jgi:hypothetical protein
MSRPALKQKMRLATRTMNATTAKTSISSAGRMASPGVLLGIRPKMVSIACLDSQSMRFIATWKPSSIRPPRKYRGENFHRYDDMRERGPLGQERRGRQVRARS